MHWKIGKRYQERGLSGLAGKWRGVEKKAREGDGKSHREQAEAKKTRREREVPGEEGEKIKRSKRKVIRVESEETQDYVERSEE